MSYATIDEYEARFGAVADHALLQECLNDCSEAIDLALERHGGDCADRPRPSVERLKMVCRSMANRIMPSEGGADIPVGATQASFTAGPYNQQFTFQTTYGVPKPNAEELKMLGVGGARIGFARLT